MLATVSDAKLPEAKVLSFSDYYAFGSAMPGRSGGAGYRFGFNGKENDGDFGNAQLIQDYGFRLYNPAIGKFLSVDPLAQSYPWNSVYAFAEGGPIANVDLDGLEKLSFQAHMAMNSGNGLAAAGSFVLDWLSDSFDFVSPQKRFIEKGFEARETKERREREQGTMAEAVPGEDPIHQYKAAHDNAEVVHTKLQAAEAATEVAAKAAQLQGLAFDAALGMANLVPKSAPKIKAVPVDANKFLTVLPRMDRVRMFGQNLQNAKPASSVDEAIKLINKTLDDVEDVYSGVLRNPNAVKMPNIDDGRMYGILDNKYVTQLSDGTTRAFTRKNTIIFNQEGGFKIYVRDRTKPNQAGALILEKAGQTQ